MIAGKDFRLHSFRSGAAARDKRPLPWGSANRVDENIYIGGYLAAADPNFVRSENIKRVVKLFADDPTYHGGYHRHPNVKYLVVNAKDSPDYDIQKVFPETMMFIREGLKRREKILVHCHAGVSRSATIVLLHLIVNRGCDLKSAMFHLRKVRPVVKPNSGFFKELRRYDLIIARLRHREKKSRGVPRGYVILGSNRRFLSTHPCKHPIAQD